jgi:hypothetical protein
MALKPSLEYDMVSMKYLHAISFLRNENICNNKKDCVTC